MPRPLNRLTWALAIAAMRARLAAPAPAPALRAAPPAAR